MQRQIRWLLLSGAVLVGVMVLLRIAGPGGGSRQPAPPVIAHAGSFVVTNQMGDRVESEQMRGRPWAINLIFTRCPGPCAQLTGVLRSVQDKLPTGSRAGLMSLTSDPEFDTPRVLRAYGAKFGADPARWYFVTGGLPEIRRLATEQLLLVLQDIPEEERASPDDLFLHSTLIVLMDGEGRLRGVVEAMERGAADRVIEILEALEREGRR